jgi:8-oxo-dGTP diphosphatase
MEINYLNGSREGWLDDQHKRVSSAAMILENERGEALIVKARYKNYWSLPSGIVDPGDTPKEAALRETLEEVGIDVHPEGVEFFAVVNRRSDSMQTYQFVFTAPLLSSMVDHVSLQASEIEAHALVTKEQVLSGDREYGKVLKCWALGTAGYIEQTF